MKLTQEEIKQIIPHRDPMLLVSTVEEMVPGESIVTTFWVDPQREIFKGHFPAEPVMPGVLIIEALAQVGAVAILSLPENKGRTAYFGAINSAKFKGKVVPGDVLLLETEIIKSKGPIGIGSAKAYVNDKIVAQVELTFALGKAEQAHAE